MLKHRSVTWMFSIGLIGWGAGVVFGQNYPNKPIRIVTAQVGGGSDFVVRLIAQGLVRPLGQPVIVDNRPTGVIPAEIVARAPADGYTLLFYGTPLWLQALLLDKVSYDPIRDFSPITMAVRSPLVLVVNPSVPANSVKDLIALAKAKPGVLNYASGGSGSTPHLTAEYFKSLTGVNIVHIPYPGGAAAINDVIADRVQLTFLEVAVVAPHMKSGRVRTLAVTSAEPSPLVPGVPTVAASGLRGFEAVQRNSAFAPAKTPAVIIKLMNQEIARVLNQAGVKEKLLSSGVEVIGSSPEQLTAAIKFEMATWGKLIKDVGITTN